MYVRARVWPVHPVAYLPLPTFMLCTHLLLLGSLLVC